MIKVASCGIIKFFGRFRKDLVFSCTLKVMVGWFSGVAAVIGWVHILWGYRGLGMHSDDCCFSQFLTL